MKFYIEHIDNFDGRKCYSVIEANNKENAKSKFLKGYPCANICGIEEIPDRCLTVGELKDILDGLPYCMPVYINSDGESIASKVSKTLAFGMFKCVEIS